MPNQGSLLLDPLCTVLKHHAPLEKPQFFERRTVRKTLLLLRSIRHPLLVALEFLCTGMLCGHLFSVWSTRDRNAARRRQ